MAGHDPTFGKPVAPYLAQLRYSAAEQKVFLGKIAAEDGTMVTIRNGDHVGDATSGSGKLHVNAVVRFDPLPSTGRPRERDNRMVVYTHDETVRYGGQCVIRRVTLFRPLVCDNWSRPSDEILPLGIPPIRKESE